MKCPGWEKFKMFSVFCFLTELLDVVLLPGDVQEEHLLVLVLGEDLLLDPKTGCWGGWLTNHEGWYCKSNIFIKGGIPLKCFKWIFEFFKCLVKHSKATNIIHKINDYLGKLCVFSTISLRQLIMISLVCSRGGENWTPSSITRLMLTMGLVRNIMSWYSPLISLPFWNNNCHTGN